MSSLHDKCNRNSPHSHEGRVFDIVALVGSYVLTPLLYTAANLNAYMHNSKFLSLISTGLKAVISIITVTLQISTFKVFYIMYPFLLHYYLHNHCGWNCHDHKNHSHEQNFILRAIN